MAIAVVFDFPGLPQAKYDASVARLTNGKGISSLSDWPVPGVLMHVAGPTATGFRVIDVWESEAQFRAFGEVLVPILKELDFPDAQPQIFPAYKFVKA